MNIRSQGGQALSHRFAVGAPAWICILTASYVVGAVLTWPERYLTILQNSLHSGYRPLLSLTVIGLCLLAVAQRKQRPLEALLDTVKQRGWAGTLILISFVFGTSAYTTYKIAIPDIVPYYADSFLAWVGMVTHGDYPWRLTHAILPDALAPVLIELYGSVWITLWFGLVILAAFLPKRTAANRYLSAMALTLIICGTVLAMALSSVGPIYFAQFYGGTLYAELMETLQSNSTFAPVLTVADFLLTNYTSGTPEVGTGISAAPSVHVAIATLNAFFLMSINRWLGLAAWAFAAAILFGSVYFGWHYAIDGYISIAVVSLIWWVLGRSARQPVPAPSLQPSDFAHERIAT